MPEILSRLGHHIRPKRHLDPADRHLVDDHVEEHDWVPHLALSQLLNKCSLECRLTVTSPL